MFTSIIGRKKTSIITIFLGLIIVLTSSCSLLLPEEQEPLPPPLAEPPEPNYSFYTVKRDDMISQINEGGVFVPVSEIPLNFGNNSGRLAELNVKMGDRVTKGQVLAKLDVGDLEHSLEEKKINLKKQELNYDKIMIDYNELLASIKEAKDQLAKAKDQGSKEDTEKWSQQLESLEKQKEKQDIDIEIFKLGLSQQETDLERTKERLEKAQLISPIDGIIGFEQGFSMGDWVDTHTTVYTVVDPSDLYLRLNSASVTGLHLGMKADVIVGDQVYSGEVVMTPSSSNEETRDQRLRNAIILSVEGLPNTVMPGDRASIRVVLEERNNVVVLPRAGLRTYGSRNYVLVRDGDTNREIDIEIGMETPTYIEVISGIDEGDTIILR
ncbi:MAG: biotin/lipoyl-binding protein [Caldicoprobacterales bacterium]|jgi:multidrug efflux pump subunit AcrA (membrane-fusion protein)|nr:biotin/lipoyl-binding protein [Clostridiales bacterium]